MLVQIITGIVGGLAYSVAGLANANTREKFDWSKMVPTIVISGIIGAIAGYTSQDYGIVANGSMAAGITVIVQKGFQAIWKRIK